MDFFFPLKLLEEVIAALCIHSNQKKLGHIKLCKLQICPLTCSLPYVQLSSYELEGPPIAYHPVFSVHYTII